MNKKTKKVTPIKAGIISLSFSSLFFAMYFLNPDSHIKDSFLYFGFVWLIYGILCFAGKGWSRW